MSVQYLVDFENVHEAGLYGMDLLGQEDNVYILHTSSCDRIPLWIFDNVQAWIRVVPVPPGNQSLDMHLVSLLGYLIGKEEDSETRYVIISGDKDYQNIIEFWNRTYQTDNKVQYMKAIVYSSDSSMNSLVISPAELENVGQRVRDHIIRIIQKHGQTCPDGKTGMQLSALCSWLNGRPEYVYDLKRLNKKPMQYLTEEHGDIIWIRRTWKQEWAILRTENLESGPIQHRAAEAVPAAGNTDKAEEVIPDIIDMGDLNIDDGLNVTEETAKTETGPMEVQPEEINPEDRLNPAEAAVSVAKEPSFNEIAGEIIRKTSWSERNRHGHVRVSAIRDELMTIPTFRASLKESGMKPIPYLQQALDGHIVIYREKGIYWATDEPKAPSEGSGEHTVFELKKAFYDKAISNLQERLSDVGIDPNTVTEIADICMHSDNTIEPRKEIHNLLCQRFGPKVGAKYYRQTVKYLS